VSAKFSRIRGRPSETFFARIDRLSSSDVQFYIESMLPPTDDRWAGGCAVIILIIKHTTSSNIKSGNYCD